MAERQDRLFVAVPLPPQPLAACQALIDTVRAGPYGDVPRWVHLTNLHLTVRSLGEIPRDLTPDAALAVRDALEGVRAFEVVLAGAGSLPTGRKPRALWLGIEHGAAELGASRGRPGSALVRSAGRVTTARTDRTSRSRARTAHRSRCPRYRRCARAAAADGGRPSARIGSCSTAATSAVGPPGTSRSSRRGCLLKRHGSERLARTSPETLGSEGPAAQRPPEDHIAMATALPRRTKFVLDEDRIPRAWYNIAADLPVPLPPPLHPGTGLPLGPADLEPLFPMALILQEVSTDREIEIPDPVREAYQLYRPSPLIRAHRLERGPRHPGPHLLQVRGREPGRLPQAEHGLAAGVLQQGGRRHAPRDRDRRRAVGQCARVCRLRVRARGQGLHGPRELRPEAVPPDPDGDVRCVGGGEPQPGHELRPQGARRDAGLRRVSRHGHQRGRRRTPRPATTPSTRWGPCSTT